MTVAYGNVIGFRRIESNILIRIHPHWKHKIIQIYFRKIVCSVVQKESKKSLVSVCLLCQQASEWSRCRKSVIGRIFVVCGQAELRGMVLNKYPPEAVLRAPHWIAVDKLYISGRISFYFYRTFGFKSAVCGSNRNNGVSGFNCGYLSVLHCCHAFVGRLPGYFSVGGFQRQHCRSQCYGSSRFKNSG